MQPIATFTHSTVITLAGTYGYHPEDITILKDHRDFPDDAQPTRANMVRDSRSPSPSYDPH